MLLKGVMSQRKNAVSEGNRQASGYYGAGLLAEILVASIGVALLACALGANQRWLDRHFVPSFFLPRHWYVVIETLVRLAMGIVGVWLALIAQRQAGRFAARTPARAFQVVIAVGLALGASELLLRYVHLRPAEWLWPADEPRRQVDPRLGWTRVSGRTGYKDIGGGGGAYRPPCARQFCSPASR